MSSLVLFLSLTAADCPNGKCAPPVTAYTIPQAIPQIMPALKCQPIPQQMGWRPGKFIRERLFKR